METPETVCSNVHAREKEIVRCDTAVSNRITRHGEVLGEVNALTQLGIITGKQERSDADVESRIAKARSEFL